MSNTEKRSSIRKSTILGLTKLPEKATILSISQALANFASNITSITIETNRFGQRSANISFDSVESCEKAKELGSIKIDNQNLDLFFAHSKNNSPSLSASQNKVYVKYPLNADYDEIVKLLGDVTIRKPEGAKNYFFATCKDIDQQCEIVKNLNNKKIDGGVLSVKVAIDKTVKKPVRPKPTE